MKLTRYLLTLASLTFVALATLATVVVETKSHGVSPQWFTPATCWCKISKDDLWSKTSATGVLMDITGEVNKTYVTQSENNQQECQSLCKTAAGKWGHYIFSPSIASSACAAGVPDGTLIRAFSAVGNTGYREAIPIGHLTNEPQVTQTKCKCPSGWQCNGCSPQVDGGYTSDGKCKKVACLGNSIPPYPPNGTPIGSWGFTWGDSFQAWGTSANGGAPSSTLCVTTVIQPHVCSWH
jgi:hypothetical protein